MLAPPPKGASFGRAWKPKDNDAAQERSLVAHCLALCAGCERCRFVSLSAQWNDCRCLGLGLGLGLRGLGVGLRGLGLGLGLELGLRHSPPTPTPARHSWYHNCPLNRLDTKTAGFFSGAALSNSSRGLAHSRPS